MGLETTAVLRRRLMAIETALRIRLPNRPGELARVARQLANAGVNIRSVVCLTLGGRRVPLSGKSV